MAIQFVREAPAALSITAFDGREFRIGEQRLSGSIALSHAIPARTWAASDPLDADSLGTALTLQAEIVIIGTGTLHRFPSPEALRPLIEAGIAFEIMATRAACRTYNVLLSEGRKVGALLIA
jgi:Uncharacterized conserved protein